MKREDQIKKFMDEESIPESYQGYVLDGIAWADEHPNSEDVIDKAHIWLMENYDKYVRVIGSSIYFAYFELGRDFRKAMEE